MENDITASTDTNDQVTTADGQAQSTQTQIPGLEPTILVIFGVTGDLAKRYLMPSLYHLFKQGLLHPNTEIVGISRRRIDLDELFNSVEMCVSEDDKICDPIAMAHMHSHTRGHQLDMDDPQAYVQLRSLLDSIETEQGVCMNRLYYLAIPPLAYSQVVVNMGKAGLNASCEHGQAMTRLLVEKPFGHDLASAEALIQTTAAAFGEQQVFRIDHYLAKETAQNISTFRFENPLFETIWNNRHVDSIDIVASEKIGVEGRGNFYEQQGALRDFIQNHLFQLLAVATMEQPERFDSDAVHAAKLALLQAIVPITAEQVSQQSKRGQYIGYRDEVGNADSHVETFAQVQTTINTPRWQGVPVRIRTGKAMSDKRTIVTFNFSDRDAELPDLPNSNQLQFRIQPDEGISLHLLAKKPGYSHELQPVAMDFSYNRNFDSVQPTAYERVLVDTIRGDQTLFASSQEVLAAWRIVDAVVQEWQENKQGLIEYPSGTAIDTLV